MNRNNSADGYFTVEAAFIVPLALAVLVLVLHLPLSVTDSPTEQDRTATARQTRLWSARVGTMPN